MAMPLLQLTLPMVLSGVLTPVFNLNVRFLLFRRFFAHFFFIRGQWRQDENLAVLR